MPTYCSPRRSIFSNRGLDQEILLPSPKGIGPLFNRLSSSFIPLSPAACLRVAASAKAGERDRVRGKLWFKSSRILVVFLSCFDKIGLVRLEAQVAASGENLMRSKSRIGGYILIALGIIFLLSNLGWLPPLRSLTAHWWPLLLIIVGIWLLLRHKSSGKT